MVEAGFEPKQSGSPPHTVLPLGGRRMFQADGTAWKKNGISLPGEWIALTWWLPWAPATSPGPSPSQFCHWPRISCSRKLGGLARGHLAHIGASTVLYLLQVLLLGPSHHSRWASVALWPPLAEEERSKEEWRQPTLGSRDVFLGGASLDWSLREAAESQAVVTNLASGGLLVNIPYQPAWTGHLRIQANSLSVMRILKLPLRRPSGLLWVSPPILQIQKLRAERKRHLPNTFLWSLPMD